MNIALFGKEEDSGQNFGKANYQERVEILEAAGSSENPESTLSFISESLKIAAETYTIVKEVFRPQFLSRYYSKKIHEKQLVDADR